MKTQNLTIAISLFLQAIMLVGGLVLANITYIDHRMGFAANVLAFCLESAAAIWFCLTMLQLRRQIIDRKPTRETSESSSTK